MDRKNIVRSLIITAVAVISIVDYSVFMKKAHAPEQGEMPPEVTSTVKTYRSSAYNFVFKYPASSTLYESKDKEKIQSLSYIPPCEPELSVVCVAIPPSLYANTNFGGAGFSVNYIADGKNEQSCITGSESAGEKINRNGITFYHNRRGDAAMSHQSAEEVYRTFHDGACLEAALRINSTTFEVYESGTVDRFTDDDRSAVTKALENVFSTFRFTD